MILRKDELGNIRQVAGGVIQRWNDRIFLTTHTIEGGDDYYTIEDSAKKYIMALTNYTEFQLYISVPNTTSDVYIRFNGQTLKLFRSDGGELGLGFLTKRITFYTLDTSDGKIWLDSLLQPIQSDYKGTFTFALQTWDEEMILEPQIGNSALALDTLMTYEYDGTDWNEEGTISTPENGWYWLIEFFPDYYFGNGTIIWNGASNSWNVYTSRQLRPDEDTILIDENTQTFKTNDTHIENVVIAKLDSDNLGLNSSSKIKVKGVKSADNSKLATSDEIISAITIVYDL